VRPQALCTEVDARCAGFGEIFAREWISIYFNIGPKRQAPTTQGRPNVSTVGVRAAGAARGGNVKPGVRFS
jgi:hypothetical protein